MGTCDRTVSRRVQTWAALKNTARLGSYPALFPLLWLGISWLLLLPPAGQRLPLAGPTWLSTHRPLPAEWSCATWVVGSTGSACRAFLATDFPRREPANSWGLLSSGCTIKRSPFPRCSHSSKRRQPSGKSPSTRVWGFVHFSAQPIV